MTETPFAARIGAKESSSLGDEVLHRRSGSYVWLVTGVGRLLLVVATIWWLILLIGVWHKPLTFDDSFMFYRYAHNFRSGLGISWNLDGVHTYGETSLLWGFVVLGLSFLPLTAGHVLILGSWLFSGAAIVAAAWAGASTESNPTLSSTFRVLPWIAFPLIVFGIFTKNATSGMETMLAAALDATFLGLSLGWSLGRVRPQVVGAFGLALFLCRPESAILVVLTPTLIFLLLCRKPGWELASLLGVFLGGVLVELVLCKAYFHTPVPLGFYMKTGLAYEGYAQRWYPLHELARLLVACCAPLLVAALLFRRNDWRLLACFLVPALVIFGYLISVRQIMGRDARYYLPYFSLFTVPAVLLVDRRVKERITLAAWISGRRIPALALIPLVLLGMRPWLLDLERKVQDWVEPVGPVYEPVHLETLASSPLPPHEWFANIQGVGGLLLNGVPSGTTIAASEVGLLGAANPQVNVIDLAGLNDTQIALHGFHMNDLLRRKPDIIWMPHDDYTWQRGVMLSDPRLMQEYDIYAGAFNYGLAIRKDSPARDAIAYRLRLAWQEQYPGFALNDYRVTHVVWTGKHSRALAK